MRARRRLAALAALGTALSIAALASAEEQPSVARPHYEGADEASSGVVSGTAAR